MTEYKKYAYSGPVLEFDHIVADNWKGETYAPSEKKARSNLAYQFKQEYNREPRVQIKLPGQLSRVG